MLDLPLFMTPLKLSDDIPGCPDIQFEKHWARHPPSSSRSPTSAGLRSPEAAWEMEFVYIKTFKTCLYFHF